MKLAAGSTEQGVERRSLEVPQQRPTASTAPVRVLVADDEVDIRTLVRLTLTLCGEDLLLLPDASDGAAALAGWREQRPDVLVLDQRMPGLTGLDVAAIVLAEDPDAAIVLFSASLEVATTRRAQSLGVPCLDKYDIHRLADMVRDLAANRRLRPTA